MKLGNREESATAMEPPGKQLRFDLDLSPDEMRSMSGMCVEAIINHIQELAASPCCDLNGATGIVTSLRESTPQEGTTFSELLEFLMGRVIPLSINTAHPSYMGYIPGGGLLPSALAEFLAAAVNRYVGVWAAAPAMARLETNVTEWFSEWVGYPLSSARGILTSGGSTANFTAVVTARQHVLGDDISQGTVYLSDQTHHSLEKAVVLAGIPAKNIRHIPSGENFRAVPSLFEEEICKDLNRGFRPFLLVGNAGTTNSGAVDPLRDLAEVSRRHSLWFHVDAAYGGFFMLCEEGRRQMLGIAESDSVTLDPHKGLFLPYGTGGLLVREGEYLRAAHQLLGAYHASLDPTPIGEMNFTDYSLEQSRSARGLNVWLPLKLFGVEAFRHNLAEKLELTQWMYEQFLKEPGFECPSIPTLSVLTFRFLPRDGDVDHFNRELLRSINATGKLYLSDTTLRGTYVIRVCVLCFRTHRDQVEQAFDLIRSEAHRLNSTDEGPRN